MSIEYYNNNILEKEKQFLMQQEQAQIDELEAMNEGIDTNEDVWMILRIIRKTDNVKVNNGTVFSSTIMKSFS
jgi:hypothetical protein